MFFVLRIYCTLNVIIYWLSDYLILMSLPIIPFCTSKRKKFRWKGFSISEHQGGGEAAVETTVMTVPVNAAVKFTLYRIFSQAFLPPCEVFVSTLSHLCCCFPQVRRGDTILAQLFYPVTMTPQIWVTTELCDRSDADELYFKNAALSVLIGMRKVTIWKGNETPKRCFHTVCNFPLAGISRGWVLVSAKCS